MRALRVVLAIIVAAGAAVAQGTRTEDQKLTAPSPAAGDAFGDPNDISGDLMVVGAPGTSGVTGAVHLYRLTAGAWTWEATITRPGTSGVFGFSAAVSVTPERELLAVGSIFEDTEKGGISGAVYVFRKVGGSWVQDGSRLVGDDLNGLSNFGHDVALAASASGDVLLVGANFHTHETQRSGTAYVFRNTGSGWVQEDELVPPVRGDRDHIGISVDLDETGEVALVGAQADGERAFEAGAAHVFRHDGAGEWPYEAKLKALDGETSYERDRFGRNVALSGNVAVCGAYFDADPGQPRAGSAYVFRFDGAAWQPEQKLQAPAPAAQDGFGIDVAIDGERILVGAWEDYTSPAARPGSAYLFEYDGDSGTWGDPGQFLASDGANGDTFAAVALSGDAAIVGAPYHDSGGLANAGAAYAFFLTSEEPVAPSFDAPADPPPESTFDWATGKPLVFDVRASDANTGNVVTLSVSGLPAGATLDPPLPASGNPVATSFSWTPSAAEAGRHVIVFTASDGALASTLTLTVDARQDSDGDGLPDLWETDGYTHPNGVFVNLPALGADPRRKDLFVEIDYMVEDTGDPGVDHSHRPRDAALDRIVQAFAAAPVPNPDGSTGITLHLLVDEALPHLASLGAGGATSYDWAEFDALKADHFAKEKELAFHYCVFAHRLGGDTSSGLSRGAPAQDLIVSLGAWLDNQGVILEEWEAGTFMHELGHNLSLRHGGADDVRGKPNYLSVMNLPFQLDGLKKGGQLGYFDYSRWELPPLVEDDLDEARGLDGPAGDPFFSALETRWRDFYQAVRWGPVTGALDWDQDGDATEHPVTCPSVPGFLCMDLNGDSQVSTLLGHNDWAHLAFAGGNVGGGVPLPVPPATSGEELTLEVANAQRLPPLEGVKGHRADKLVVLTWNPVGPRKDYLYHVYRGPVGGPLDRLGSTRESNYADRTVEEDMTYEYSVTYVDALGRESALSTGVRPEK